MKTPRFWAVLLCAAAFLVGATFVSAQKQKPTPKPSKKMIFAVLNDGQTLEPIAYLNKGNLEATVNGSDEKSILTAFANSHYKAGTTYRMIFGGVDAGTVAVKTSNVKAECAPNTANVASLSSKTSLKGFVMALATDAEIKNKSFVRRKPTTEEKKEIDALVRSEYSTHQLTAKTLHYQNLTAIDIDHDGKAELVGSYWIDVDAKTRALLFFIAEKGAKAKYAMTYTVFRSVEQADVMSADIKDIDKGVFHELLLDSFDYDGDGVAEIFTYTQSFEGAGFTAYKRTGGKWTKAFESANYHCGY